MRQISMFRFFFLAASAISLAGSGCGKSVSVLSTDGAVEPDAPMSTGGAFGGNSGSGGSQSSVGTVGAGGTASIGGSGGNPSGGTTGIGGSGGNATGGTTSAGGSAGAASGGVGGSGGIATLGTGGTSVGSGGTPTGGRSGSGGAAGTGGTNPSGGTIGTGGTGPAGGTIATGGSTSLSNGSYSLPPDRVTTWNPGLNAVGGIPTTYTQCGSTISPSGGDDTSTIQAALNSCAAKHYVLLAAGTFKITGEGLTIGNSQVVLRGAGAGKTILTKPTGSNYPVIIIGTRWPNNAAGVALTADAAKEATQNHPRVHQWLQPQSDHRHRPCRRPCDLHLVQ